MNEEEIVHFLTLEEAEKLKGQLELATYGNPPTINVHVSESTITVKTVYAPITPKNEK